MGYPPRMAKARRRLDPFAIARSILRPHLYVGLLDAAATTGYMPTLDRFGKLDPNHPAVAIDMDQRLATLRFLTDKSLATPKADEGAPVLDLDQAIADLRALTAVELTALSNTSEVDINELVVIDDEAEPNPLAVAPAAGEGSSGRAGAALSRED